jgi:predicted amino acid dehydrogenase
LIQLVPCKIRQVIAILAEPVQGEGGVYPLTDTQVQNLNRLKDIFNCPLIADEVQSGSGRCGFLIASSNIGLNADYYALSKALGGGFVKIGVVAIRKRVFQFGFDLIQSSTFGEDDLSCKVALEYLNLLFDGPNPLINRVKTLGAKFATVLDDLSQKYPDIIKEVRYKGLLLGIEFNSTTDSSSYIFQNIAAQHSLGYVISGYLLNAHNIRVAPSGSAENVVRFEPSLYLEHHHITLLHECLDQLCLAIRYADVGYLLRPIITRGKVVPDKPKDFRIEYLQPKQPADYRVAFINHLISIAGLRDIDPSIAHFSDEELQIFITNSKFNLTTAPFKPARVRSKDGKSVDFIIYPIPVTSQMIADAITANDLYWLRSEVEKRIDQAINDGCYSVGLGMFTSIISNNGKSIKSNKIKITTGNALTAGMGIKAVKNTLKDRDISQLDLAVVGGAGNIGSIYAEIVGVESNSILLVGSNRQDSLHRLQKVKYNIYSNYYHLIRQNVPLKPGLLKRLASIIFSMSDEDLRQCDCENPGKFIDSYLTLNYPNESFISVSQTIGDIANYDVIICATNATESFIQCELLKSNAVICDIAVPHNFSEVDFSLRNDITLLRGGVVKTPLNDGLDSRVRAYLAENELYACMTESILLALAQYPSHFSYGNISSEQVFEVMNLADKYGFSLAGIKKDPSL